MFGDVSMNYDYVNVSSFRLLSRCFARTRCTLCGAGGSRQRSGHVLHGACASSHPAAIDAAMLPKRPLDSQKPAHLGLSLSHALLPARDTQLGLADTHAHTHIRSEAWHPTSVSHDISVSCVLWSERHMLWSHTPPSSVLTFAAPRTEHPWSPFLFPDGLPT
jgi:hypothetical protein